MQNQDNFLSLLKRDLQEYIEEDGVLGIVLHLSEGLGLVIFIAFLYIIFNLSF